jgi:hypothetical protein
MEWLKKKSAQQELDRSEKRISKLEQLSTERESLSNQLEQVEQTSSVKTVELSGLTAV